MSGKNWFKLKNRSQDFIVLMGAVELVILVLHAILELAQVSQGWTTAALRITSIILVISFSIWLVTNERAAKAGMIYSSAFDPIAGWMVVGAYVGSFLPALFVAYLPPVIVWAVPIAHALLGITWLAIRTLLEFSGQS